MNTNRLSYLMISTKNWAQAVTAHRHAFLASVNRGSMDFAADSFAAIGHSDKPSSALEDLICDMQISIADEGELIACTDLKCGHGCLVGCGGRLPPPVSRQ